MATSEAKEGRSGPTPHFRTFATRTSNRPAGDAAAYVEETPRMYRIFLEDAMDSKGRGKGRLLMESKAAYLFYMSSSFPRLAFPKKDVCFVKEKSGTQGKNGEASTGLVDSDVSFTSNALGDRYLDLVRPDGSKIEQVAWTVKKDTVIEGPLGKTLSPADLVVLETGKFPSIWEEDAPLLGHVKDPYHRVDAVRTSRRIQILISSEEGKKILVADTASIDPSSGEHATAVFETNFPTRYYLPPSALLVNGASSQVKIEPPPGCSVDAFPESALSFTCPYKGVSRYHLLTLPDGKQLSQTVWAYPEPIPALNLAGLVCFDAPHGKEVKLVVDGESMEL